MATTNQNRMFVTLTLPLPVPQLIKVTQAIIAAQTGNPHIPSPSPPLATLTVALDALVTTEAATKTRAAGTVGARNVARNNLRRRPRSPVFPSRRPCCSAPRRDEDGRGRLEPADFLAGEVGGSDGGSGGSAGDSGGSAGDPGGNAGDPDGSAGDPGGNAGDFDGRSSRFRGTASRRTSR